MAQDLLAGEEHLTLQVVHLFLLEKAALDLLVGEEHLILQVDS